MSERILYVDDDENILAAYKRVLRGRFEVETALGGEEGLEKIVAASTGGGFAVVISDMRMPGMDGVTFLAAVRETTPDTVRMMLTGNADLQTSIDAVNEGHIFRFLTKPCPKEVLIKSVAAALEQHRMIIAERQLLEETLNGSIKVMTDILSLVSPMAFGRASRVRRFVRHIAEALGLANVWQIEVAAMLSQVGCVSIPDETLKRIYAGQQLTDEEQQTFASHADVGGRLIVNIPRLEEAGHMIARQQEPFSWDRSGQAPRDRDPVAVGGHVLKVALDFDSMLAGGLDGDSALEALRTHSTVYDGDIVEALATMKVRPPEHSLQAVNVRELDTMMILDQDVRARNGSLLVTRGQEVTLAVLEHLRRWTQGVGVDEPIQVIVPTYLDENVPAELAAAREG